MIKVINKGDFSKTYKFLREKDRINKSLLDKYGRMGVSALQNATPVDTGVTASSWYYEVEQNVSGIILQFKNKNIQNGVPIAIILQYGHGTRNGGWVQGRDYINPVIQPLFDKIADEAWKEVTK